MNFYDKPDAVFDNINERFSFIFNKHLGDIITDISIQDVEDVYYEGELINENLSTKFEKLLNSSGWLHFENGTSFKVEGKKIQTIKLVGKSLGCLKKINSKLLIQKLGKPNVIDIDELNEFDPFADSEIVYRYTKKKLIFYFESDEKGIIELWVY